MGHIEAGVLSHWLETRCVCVRLYVCIYVIGKKKGKKRSMALVLAEFEVL